MILTTAGSHPFALNTSSVLTLYIFVVLTVLRLLTASEVKTRCFDCLSSCGTASQAHGDGMRHLSIAVWLLLP
jgi:hypothetical protein